MTSDKTHDQYAEARRPRWVRNTGITIAVVVVLLIAVVLLSGGKHGPGRHFGNSVDTPAPASNSVSVAPTNGPSQ